MEWSTSKYDVQKQKYHEIYRTFKGGIAMRSHGIAATRSTIKYVCKYRNAILFGSVTKVSFLLMKVVRKFTMMSQKKNKSTQRSMKNNDLGLSKIVLSITIKEPTLI